MRGGSSSVDVRVGDYGKAVNTSILADYAEKTTIYPFLKTQGKSTDHPPKKKIHGKQSMLIEPPKW